jgi:hypothetical protein
MLIAAIGMPGSGKSTVMKRLGIRLEAQVFCEPEESEWPAAVRNRELSGHVTAIQWFRSARVPGLFQARAIANRHELALVDSYYDKLWKFYLGQPGMEWLISPSDPYFNNLVALADLDYELLPDADILIFFEVAAENYDLMLKRRGRVLDRDAKLHEKADTQRYFLDAAVSYVEARKGQTKLIRYQNSYSSPEESAESLLLILKESLGTVA